MTVANYNASLAWVWGPSRDIPDEQGHVTPGDPGKLTKGGVTAATWAQASQCGIVKGDLSHASDEQLSAVLRALYWSTECDALPAGLDLLLFDGRMLTGHFAILFQQSLGMIGPDDVDGWIGPETLARARSCDPGTFIDAVSGAHAAYLASLPTWRQFGGGWTKRIRACQAAAIAMADAAPSLRAAASIA